MTTTSRQKDSSRAQILGVRVDSTPKDRLLKILKRRIAVGKKTIVLTPNPEFLVFANRHPWFLEALNKADFKVADGTGLQMAAEYLKKTAGKSGFWARLLAGLGVGWQAVTGGGSYTVLPERIAGADLFEDLCKLAAGENWRVYFLGGAPGVAEAAFLALREKYPKLEGRAESGPGLELDAETGKWRTKAIVLEELVAGINAGKPQLVFLALTMAKQVKFMADFSPKLKAGLIMGVGGTFDYYSLVPRAPEKWRRQGLEWLFRFIKEPRRWRRIFRAVFVFPWLVFREAGVSPGGSPAKSVVAKRPVGMPKRPS